MKYQVREIFKDNPDNPLEVVMTIPIEIMKSMNWEEGTVITIENTQHGIKISTAKG